jgi:pyruvate carboxylase
VLKGEAPLTDRPGKHLPPVDLEATRAKLAEDLRLATKRPKARPWMTKT